MRVVMYGVSGAAAVSSTWELMGLAGVTLPAHPLLVVVIGALGGAAYAWRLR